MKSNNKNLKPKKVRMIEVRGISGILKLLFFAICAIAGFGVFPGVALMYLWNTLISANTTLPAINLLQGLLLYGICIVSYFIANKPKFSISCGSFSDLSDEELEQIFAKAKADTEKRIKMSGIELCQAKLEEIENLKKEQTEEKETKEV